ncbi:efflux RND transporter periplasmic adaptor subunit [bacterium]|nr:efflux RND transporter periplasmic adaptor subunit [bacterium]
MKARIIILTVTLLAFSACGNGNDDALQYTGIIDANTVRVSAETPGRIIALEADEGNTVKRGDLLARVETERLDYQLAQSGAQQMELAHQITAAKSRLNAARVQRDNLATRLERFRALLKQEAVTRQAVDDLSTQFEAAEAEIAAAEASLAALQSKTGQIDAGQDIVRKQLRDADIVSPLDGNVLVRYADRGELLGIGSPVFEIADLSELWTKIYIPEKRLPEVMLGQRVSVRIDGSDEVLYGTVSWISESAEFTPKSILTEETRTALVYPVKVTVPNDRQLLKIGMPVTVTMEKGKS